MHVLDVFSKRIPLRIALFKGCVIFLKVTHTNLIYTAVIELIHKTVHANTDT